MTTPTVESYADKGQQYFANARREILPLIPKTRDRVLEIGCGSGETLAMLRSERGCGWMAGIELFPDAAERARAHLDAVYEGDIETMEIPFSPASLDVVLCLDVLEHLRDPWRIVQQLTALLRPGGALIASIPNVRHFTVVMPLLFRGEWKYTDSGLLDRTHLRFFTRATAVALVESGGLRVDAVEVTGLIPGSRRYRFDRLTGGLLRPFFVNQYLVRGIR